MIKMEEIVEEFKVKFDSVVEVNDGGYELGFEQGIEHAKSTLTEKEITANGEYAPQGDSLGFNKVIVNVPDINGSYDNGFTDGQVDGYNNALEKLTELEVKGNGEYLPSGESIGFKKVVATGYLDTSDATATPEKILDGYTAYVNNEKIEGTIPKYTGESENAEIKASKLASLVEGTITEITEKDLAGATKIKNYCFAQTTLTSVVLPNTVTSIGQYAFNSCSLLTNVILPESLTSIYNYAFNGCSNLPNIIIPSKVTTIGNNAFYGCMRMVTCSLENNNSLLSIGQQAFFDCDSLTSITIPNTVTSIGSSAFQNSGITSIDIPNTVTSIGSNTFYNCSSLTSVTIGSGVTYIDSYAFRGCPNLTNLTIPANVTSIRSYALTIGSSTNKATIIFEGTTPPTTFYVNAIDIEKLEKIIVPKGYGEVYKSATNFSNFADYIFESET